MLPNRPHMGKSFSLWQEDCDRKISEGILGSGVLKDIVNMPEYFFEGAEKLLEMWFTSDDVKILRNADLRDIKR